MPVFDKELVDNVSNRDTVVPKIDLGSPIIDTPVTSMGGFENFGEKTSVKTGLSVEDLSKVQSNNTATFDSPFQMVSKGELLENKRYALYERGKDLENAYGMQQGVLAQLGNGIIKMGATAVGAFAQSFATIPNTVSAIKSGKIADLSGGPDGYEGSIDNWLKNLENKFPNFYTKTEKERGLWTVVPFTTGSANFWGDKIIKNIGFTVGAIGGALVQDAAIGALTGGLGDIPLTSAQVGKAALWMNKIFTGTNDVEKVLAGAMKAGVGGKALLDIAKLGQIASGQANILKAVNGARYAVNLYGASRTEAGIEARDGYRQIKEDLVKQYKMDNLGAEPTATDLVEMNKYATDGMNTRFGINMALLTVSNAIQFDSLFKSFSKAAGKTASATVTKSIADAGKVGLIKGSLDTFEKKSATTLGGKIWDTVKPSIPLVLSEGVYEEGGQYAAERGTYDYFTRKYKNMDNPKYKDNWNKLNEVISSTNYGLREQFGTDAGVENMFIGALSALITGGVMGKVDNIRGKGSNARLQQTINNLNQFGLTGILQDKYTDTLNSVGIAKEMDEAVASGDVFKYNNLKHDMLFQFVNSRIPSGMHDVTIEQLNMLKDLSKEDFEKTFGMSFDTSTQKTVGSYVDTLIDKANHIKDIINTLDNTFKNPFTYRLNTADPEEAVENRNHNTFNGWKTELAYLADVPSDVDIRLESIQLKNPLLSNEILGSITEKTSIEEMSKRYEERAFQLNEGLANMPVSVEKEKIKQQIKGLRNMSERINVSLSTKTMDEKVFHKLLNYELNAQDNTKPNMVPPERSVELMKASHDINRLVAQKKNVADLYEKLSSKEGFERYFDQAEAISNEISPEIVAPEAVIPVVPIPTHEFTNTVGVKESPEIGREYESATTKTSKVTKLAEGRYKVEGDPTIYNTPEKAEEAKNDLNSSLSALAKVKILALNENGTVKVEDLYGDIQNISPNLLDGYSKIQTVQEKLGKDKAKVDKEQGEYELNSGTLFTGDPTLETIIPEDKIKATNIFYISSISESEDNADPTQSAPHVKASREFLNKVKTFKNKETLRAILVTPNQEDELGLTGLTSLSYGLNNLEGSKDINTGFVAQVFVDRKDGKTFFVDKEGNHIGEVGTQVDISKVIFQTMPTTEVNNSKGNPRYRQGEKEEFIAQAKGWATKRAELFAEKNASNKLYKFTISRGIPIPTLITGGIAEKNHVSEVLVSDKDIRDNHTLIQIPISGVITHNGQNLKFPLGRPVLQIEDTLQFLNNNTFGLKRAESIYQVLKALAKDIQENSQLGNPQILTRKYMEYLQNVLYLRKSAKTFGNQIYIDSNTMTLFLGGDKYAISEIADKEQDIVKKLTNTYHNTNNTTLAKNPNKEFVEYRFENDTLKEVPWKHYQMYLLSSKNPDGSNRSVADTPLVVAVAKPTTDIPYSFKQKYSTLEDFELPVQKIEVKPAPAPAPKAPSTGSTVIDTHVMDGITTNTFTGFNIGPIDFTGTVDAAGNVAVNIILNATTTKAVVDKKVIDTAITLARTNGTLDATASDGQIVIDFISSKLAGELQRLKAPVAEVDIISDTEYSNFVDNNIVSDQRLSEIADKVKNRSLLSVRENAIFVAKTKEVKNLIKKEEPIVTEVPLTKEQEIAKAFEALAKGAKNAGVLNSFEKFKEGKEIIFTKPESIKAVKENEFYNTIDQVDGSVKVIGVKNPDTGEWVGISKENSIDINSTEAPEDDYRRIGIKEAGQQRMTDAEITIFKAWVTENVPNMPYEILDNIVNTFDNKTAWGVFENGVAKFYKGAIRGTEYHEVFEGIWKAFITPEQRQAVLDEFKAKSGTFIDRETGKKVAYSETTDSQAKERIADDFGDFRLGKLPARSLGEKVINFFRSILDFFRSFVSNPSLKDSLFKAINTGEFKNTLISNKIKTEAPEYKKIPGVTETQAFEYVQDMTARAAQFIFGEDKKTLFDIQKITDKQIYDKIKEVYSGSEKKFQMLGENRFNQLFKRTKEYLRTLGINFNEEDKVDINAEGTNNRSYAPEAFSTDWKKTSAFAIKFTAATLLEVEATNQGDNTTLKLPKRIISSVKGYTLNNFNKIFTTVLDKLSNTSSIYKAVKKLHNLAQYDATYVRFFQRVGGNLNTGVVEFSKFKQEDWRLFINFFQTFTKQKPEALIQYITGNEVYTAPANLFTASREIKQHWFENMKILSDTPNSTIKRNSLTRSYQITKSAFPTETPKTPEAMMEFINGIGIDLSLIVYLNFKSYQQKAVAQAIGGIYTYLQKASDVGSFTGRTLGINQQLTVIADTIVQATNPNQENTFKGVEGTNKQTATENNTPSLFENEFNDADTKSELLQNRSELNDVFSKHSIILKEGGDFFNEEGDRTKEIKVKYIDGSIYLDNNEGVATGSLTLGDRFTQEINQNVEGNYYILVPAESATEWMLNVGNHLSFTDVETERSWGKVYTIFNGYLKDDIALALDYRNRESLKSIGSRSRDLRIFKDILSPQTLKDINKLIVDEASQEDIIAYLDKNSSEINSAVKSYIESTVEETRKLLMSNNQIQLLSKKDEKTPSVFMYAHLNDSFANEEQLNKFKLSEKNVNDLLTFVNTNYIINNIEFHKILFGDPYQFAVKNGKLDETKRIKSFMSPRRTTFNLSEHNTFLNGNENKVGEIELTSKDPGYHEYKSYANVVILKDVNLVSNLYSKINEADAFSLIMDNTYKEVKQKNSQWTTEAEAWHQWQMAYTRQNMSGYVYTNSKLKEKDTALLKTPEPIFVTEVLKPIVSGSKNNQNKINLALHKMSQMPLYFKAVQGTNLEKFYVKMWKEGKDYGVFESGAKVGVENTHSLYDLNHEFNEEPFNNNTEIPWSIYGIQVENSYEHAHEQTRGSQLTKIASIDMFDNGKPIGDTPERQVAIQSAYDRHNKALDNLHENALNEFFNKLGIEDLGNGFRVRDYKSVAETLQHEMMRRELSQNALDTIQLDENGQFRIPFEASPSYKQIKDILYSLISKSLISPKMNGSPMVQVPATLWENASEGRGLIRKTETGYVKITRKEYEALDEEAKKTVRLSSDVLKFYTKEHPYCEVMLPHWFKDKFDSKKFPTDASILDYLNSTKDGRSILTGIGFRIPTQSMSSVEVFKVKGFLPQSMGNTIVVPSEITAKAGSDFDIDKLNTYLKSVYTDKNGDVKLIKYKGSEEATKEFFSKVFVDTIGRDIAKIEKYDEFRETILNIFSKIESLPDISILAMKTSFTEEEFRFYKSHLSIIQEIIDQATDQELSSYDYLLGQVKDMQEAKDKLTAKRLNDKLKSDYINEMYKRSLENEYYESLEELLILPENFERLLTPVSDGGLSIIAAHLNELRGQDETTIKNRIFNRNFMTTLRHSFIIAKKWIGIAAVNITGQSVTQKSQTYIDPARFGKIKKFDRDFLGDGTIALPHNTTKVNGKEYISIGGIKTWDGKHFISERLSGYATSFVDVANDPFIMSIIPSDLIVGTFLFMERLGIGENTIYFLNQPIITEYMKYLDGIGSRSIFSEDNLKTIRDKFPTTVKEVKASGIDISTLENNIKNFHEKGYFKDSRDNAVQHVILKEFLKLQKMASYNFKLSQAYNYDTTKFKDSNSFSKKQFATDIAERTNIFSSVREILDKNFIGKQMEAIAFAMDSMGSVLKLEEEQFTTITDKILDPYKEREFLSNEDFEKIVGKVKSSFLDYIIQIKTKLNGSIERLIVSEESVANQLVAARERYFDMKLLNDLQIVTSDIEGGAKTIKLRVNIKDSYDENLYIGMMQELKEVDPILFNNIVKLSILQGSYQSANSIKNIIPLEDYAKEITPIINSLSATDEISMFSKGMFQRNNWKDKTIVPTVQVRFNLRNEGMPMEDPYGNEIYEYFSYAFPSVPSLDIIATDRKILILSPKYNSKDIENDFIKVPRVVTSKSGDKIDIVTGQSVPGIRFVKMKAAGDLSLKDFYGYQKVKYSNGQPVLTKKGEHIYKLINLYGDGALVSEYYTDFRPSVLNNGTAKINREIEDRYIINAYAPTSEEGLTPYELLEPEESLEDYSQKTGEVLEEKSSFVEDAFTEETKMVLAPVVEISERNIKVEQFNITIATDGKMYYENGNELKDQTTKNKVNVRKELQDGTLRISTYNNSDYFVLSDGRIVGSGKTNLGKESINDSVIQEKILAKAVLHKKQC